MSRMQINALKSLIESADGGQYTLPDNILAAYRTYETVKALRMAEPHLLAVDVAAARIVAATAAGDTVQVQALAEEVAAADHARMVEGTGTRVIQEAVEQAANAAVGLTADSTERIITNHLAPALGALFEEVERAATALDGHGLDPYNLINAPAKARKAWGELPVLHARYVTLRTARQRANAIGYREAQHDVHDYFATFRKPLAFHPQWAAPAKLPAPPFPEDHVERLLWMVSPEAKAAEPWLPTVAEQDAAWWDHFGEAKENRRRALNDAKAIGARIGA